MKGRNQSGFTLIELMIVVAIMALVVKIVMVNIGALIPSSALDSVAAKIQSELDFIRSEAKIQGKQYKLQFDLDPAVTTNFQPDPTREGPPVGTVRNKAPERLVDDCVSVGVLHDDAILAGQVGYQPMIRSNRQAVLECVCAPVTARADGYGRSGKDSNEHQNWAVFAHRRAVQRPIAPPPSTLRAAPCLRLARIFAEARRPLHSAFT